MTLTPTQLAEIGRKLYGAHWQTAMANDLGVNPRTVRRWAKGDVPVPPMAAKALALMKENDK